MSLLTANGECVMSVCTGKREMSCDKNNKIYHELLGYMHEFPQLFEKRLELAIDDGYPIDYVSAIGNTLLIESIFSDVAAEAGIPDILLRHNANPNIPNDYDAKALDEAVSCYRSISLINNLISAGAEINSVDEDGHTAFYWVAMGYISSDDLDKTAHILSVAIFLLEHGADPYLCNHWIEDSVRDIDCFGAYSPEYTELLAKASAKLNVSVNHYMSSVIENAKAAATDINKNVEYKKQVTDWRTYYFRLKELKEICDIYSKC